MLDTDTHLPEDQLREYELKCKVIVKEISFLELADNKQHTADVVYLVPDHSTTEGTMFFDAYLPETGSYCPKCKNMDVEVDDMDCKKCEYRGEMYTPHSEVPVFIDYPVQSHARCAVLRKNKRCVHHHLSVMGTGAEQDLKHMNGKTVLCKIRPATMDYLCDSSKSVERTIKN